jgi:4,5:9,10-diseco-3-hydroxy-5,9,17-trioxoandrosta-1(10),2-diene-4-oate hydrolase
MGVKDKGKWVQAGVINTHYLVGGEGSPLILLHGAANNLREWRLNFDSLCQQHRVYAPDLAGYGGSDKPKVDYSPEFFADFLHDFMQALEIKKASLMGHSLGGGIALSFALRFPNMVERLIIVDSVGLGKGVSTLAKVLTPIYALTALLRVGRAALVVSKRWMKPPVNFANKLHEIQAPTLIIWGARDRILPVTQGYAAHKLIKNVQLHIFPKCGHTPQRGNPDEFNCLVLDFLNPE